MGGVVAAAPTAQAANTAGSLDPTFGKGGKVLVNLGASPTVNDALVQANGDIVLSGSFGLARFLPSGAQDTSFGQGSVAATAPGGGLAQESDGSFIVAGASTTAVNSLVVAHVLANGSPDQNFGSGGSVTTAVFPSTTSGFFTGAVATLVQPDGRILAGGTFELSGYRGGGLRGVLVRYNANGSLDPNFANNGILVSSSTNSIQALGIDSAGDIFTMPNFAEFSAGGQADTNITPSSLVATSHSGSSTFLASGQAVSGNSVFVFRGNTEIQVQRFSGSGGTISTSPLFHYINPQTAARDSASAVAVDGSGRVVVAGAHFLGTSVFGLARVTAGGSLDSGFGSGGTLTTTIQGDESVGALAIQPDGKIVAAGFTESNSTGQTEVAIVRYLGQ